MSIDWGLGIVRNIVERVSRVPPIVDTIDIPRYLVVTMLRKARRTHEFGIPHCCAVIQGTIHHLDNSINVTLLLGAILETDAAMRLNHLNTQSRWGRVVEGRRLDIYRFTRGPDGVFLV